MPLNPQADNTHIRYDGQLAALQRKIASGTSAPSAVSTIKLKFKRPDIARLTKTLANDPKLRSLIVAVPFPKDLSELRTAPLLVIGDLDAEIFWTSCVLRLFKNEINQFVQLREQFSHAMVTSQYKEAESALLKIEDLFGQSIWLIENRIALLSDWKGLEGQKEYTRSVLKRDNITKTVKYLTYHFSVRAEQNVSADRFSRMVVDSLTDPLNRSRRFINAEYYIYKLDFYSVEKFANFSKILFYESNASIIDRYETFLNICQLALAYKDTKIVRSIARSLDAMGEIDDNLFRNLCVVLEGRSTSFSQHSEEINNIVDHYTAGNYDECVRGLEPIIISHPTNLSLVELYVKALHRTGDAKVCTSFKESIKRVVEAMGSILHLDSQSAESYLFLAKHLRTHSALPWAAQLFSFLMREYLHDASLIPNRFAIFGELNSQILNPRIKIYLTHFRSLSDNAQASVQTNRITNVLIDIMRNPNFGSIDALDGLDLPTERLLRCKAGIYRSIGRLDDALKAYTILLNDCPSIVYYDVLQQAVVTEIQAGNLAKALSLTVNGCLVNSQAKIRLPIHSLIKCIETQTDDFYKSTIEWPILLDMYFQQFKVYEQERAEAYEQFIEHCNVQRPSEINYTNLAVPAVSYIYFLRNVCVPEVMDGSIHFSSHEDVQRERLRICQELIERDSPNTDNYLAEIRTLTTRIAVAQGLREVEQSKIYVDVDGVKRTLERELSESFARYIELLRFTPHEATTEQIIRTLKQAASRRDEEEEVYFPPSEKRELFGSMVIDIRDGFVSSNEYGLDTSLSMGIRHGTLAGQLRPHLETAHLVTFKDSKTGKYANNSFWLDQIPKYLNSVKPVVSSKLNEFSAEVDALISRLNQALIHVRTETKNNEGLFDFRLDDIQIHKIELRILTDTSFDEFFDLVIQTLWSMTDRSLRNITDYFDNVVKPEFLMLFDTLTDSLLACEIDGPFTQIFQMITQAKIDIQYDIERVTSWFARVRPAEIRDYPAKLPIDIGVQILNNVYFSGLITPSVSIDESLIFKGKTLTSMTNIMFNLFDNIRKYSTVSAGGQVSVDVTSIHNNVVFTMRNKVDKALEIIAANAALDDIRGSITLFRIIRKIPLDRVKSEGRSGFYKIAKILMFELLTDCDLEFGFTEDHAFEVKFSLPATTILS